MGSKETCVYVASGEFEAQQMKAFLESHGIPCQFLGEALRKTHGLTLDGLGQVEVHVPRDRVEEARQLMARVEAGELELDEDSEPQS